MPVSFLHKVDIFGASVPSFNIRGKDTIKTYLGGFLSLTILYIIFIFAVMKFQHLMIRKNPLITEFVDKNGIELGEKFDLGDSNFMVAVGMESWTRGMRDDPKFVHWVATVYTVTDNVSKSEYYPMHPCTDEDYSRFFPADERTAKKVESYRLIGGLKCLDAAVIDDFDLYGTWESDSSYRAIDLVAAPCAF
mmetsp:Transcript_27802/g.34542  ORF Transcript_27802/g.34542 Transcript_27802/m.34542 type:complete len:192 (-) Transcript_27802:347-922(-)